MIDEDEEPAESSEPSTDAMPSTREIALSRFKQAAQKVIIRIIEEDKDDESSSKEIYEPY